MTNGGHPAPGRTKEKKGTTRQAKGGEAKAALKRKRWLPPKAAK